MTNKYRVRKGLFDRSVLQVLVKYLDDTSLSTYTYQWVDVSYDQAPRALVSEMDVIDKMTRLEIELGILEGKE